MKRKITFITLGILFFWATGLGAQVNTYQSPYRGPVYATIPAKSIDIQLLSPEEVRAGARIRWCKKYMYPKSLQSHEGFRPDTLSGQSSLRWVPQMEDTSEQEHIIPYWVVDKDGKEQMNAVRVKVFNFPQRLNYHFKTDEEGRLDFAITVNKWTENVEIDIVDEHGRIVEQLKDVYQGKLDLPEGNYTANTRITTTFPILSNFTDTFSIGRPENDEVPTIFAETPPRILSAELVPFDTTAGSEDVPEYTKQAVVADRGSDDRGEEQLIQTELKVYPNPTSGKVSVVSNKTISHLRVLNVNGGQISQASPMSTEYYGDLSGLPPGYYLIRVQLEDGTVETVKLVLHEASH